MARLIINPTSSAKREIELPRSMLYIGRDPTNDLVLPDAMVSRRHAVVEYRSSQYFLRDCNSSNGSLVNGDRISERNLRDGDLVAIGTARLLFRDELEGIDTGAKVVPHPSVPRLKCPACQADCLHGDIFCRRCGARLEVEVARKVVCPACGTVLSIPAAFCTACGEPLPEQGAPLEVTKPQARPDGDHVAPPSPEPAGPEPAGPEPAGPVAAEPGLGEPGPTELAMPAPAIAVSSDPRPDPSLTRPVAVAAPLAARRPPARLRPPTPRPAAAEAAPIEARLAAGLIDAALVGLGQLVLIAPVAYYWWSRQWPRDLKVVLPWLLLSAGLCLVAVALGAIYFVYFWGVLGRTPGKRLMGLAVEASDGRFPIGVSQAFVRLLGYGLSAMLLGAGFVMILFGGSGLHDRIAGTRVVRREGE